jgi:MFS family permease
MMTAPSPRDERRILLLLTFVNLFNYIDRFIVPGIAVSLQQSALHLSDTQIGLLATGFIIVYAMASPRFGVLGDRGNRPRLIALGVGIWSIATVLGGFAIGFASLFLARATLGIGEAAYGSIAPSLIADASPRSKRGRTFAFFYAAIPIGSAMGYLVAGFMDKHFGWRSAFFVAGAPGLLLALLLLRIREIPRGAHDEPDPAPVRDAHEHWHVRYGRLLRNRRYLLTVLGYAAYTFALGALAVWMPAFLTREHHVAKDVAAYQTGLIAVATGLVGTFAGGWIADRVYRSHPHAYLLVSGVATVLAVPFVVMTLIAQQPMYYLGGLIIAELLIFASTGPINLAIISYVAPAQRATAMAFSILIMHLLGDAPSPFIVGWLSDAGRAAGLDDGTATQHALLILPAATLLGGIIWLVGARRGRPA